MDHFWHLLVFSAQVGVIVLAIAILMIIFFYLLAQTKRSKSVEIEHLNDRLRSVTHLFNQHLLSKKEVKAQRKLEKKKEKEDKQQRPKVFVLDFVGDVRASQVDELKEEVNAILSVAQPQDEVVVRLESSGGVVHGYGLAAAQLLRLKAAGFKLTVAVDKIAASGGYMMACVANRLVAAPFAIVGSIGVVAPVPNFNRLLRKHQIDYKEYTAGDFKRTVSILGENTSQGIAKFSEQLQDTHILFKDFINENRPSLNLEKVATGEHWYGRQAIELGLVDELQTSDAHLLALMKDAEVYKVTYFAKRKLSEKLADAVGQTAARIFMRFEGELAKTRYR